MSSRPRNDAILIAPLSSKPQLVTIALDLLLEQGAPIQETVVLHTSLERPETRAAVLCLSREIPSCYPQVRLRPICLCDVDGEPFLDVNSEPAAREAFRVLYREVKTAKRQGRHVHISIAGGRKIIAVYAMAVAQMLFGPDDNIWHIFSTPELIESRALHPQPGQSQLIPVPVLRWSEVSPALIELALSDDPFEALRYQEQLRRTDEVRRARDFVECHLTPAEREVVELMVCESLTDAEIAARTYRTRKTVGHQLASAYQKAREHFGIEPMDRRVLARLLTVYFELKHRSSGRSE